MKKLFCLVGLVFGVTMFFESSAEAQYFKLHRVERMDSRIGGGAFDLIPAQRARYDRRNWNMTVLNMEIRGTMSGILNISNWAGGIGDAFTDVSTFVDTAQNVNDLEDIEATITQAQAVYDSLQALAQLPSFQLNFESRGEFFDFAFGRDRVGCFHFGSYYNGYAHLNFYSPSMDNLSVSEEGLDWGERQKLLEGSALVDLGGFLGYSRQIYEFSNGMEILGGLEGRVFRRYFVPQLSVNIGEGEEYPPVDYQIGIGFHIDLSLLFATNDQIVDFETYVRVNNLGATFYDEGSIREMPRLSVGFVFHPLASLDFALNDMELAFEIEDLQGLLGWPVIQVGIGWRLGNERTYFIPRCGFVVQDETALGRRENVFTTGFDLTIGGAFRLVGLYENVMTGNEYKFGVAMQFMSF